MLAMVTGGATSNGTSPVTRAMVRKW
jgi:hypothetical protein